MFLTLHSAAAIVISEGITSRVVGFLLGVISHLVLDFFPHGDGGLDRFINKRFKNERLGIMLVTIVDLTVLLIGTMLAFRYIPMSNPEVAVWTALGAISPDLIWGLHSITGKKIKLLGWISDIHHKSQNIWKDDLSVKKGLVVQVITLVLLLYMQFSFFN